MAKSRIMITLTRESDGQKLFINPSCIAAVWKAGPGMVQVVVIGMGPFGVTQGLQQILDRIRDVS